ncbi:M14 family metallopeptidase [Balneola sp. MJW-20]|uniref:M14 family metallopeptidase n=1 Tax=Gracilimonas aurantiaca TaxID=3234185 RepID=UPI00390A6AE2
MKTIKLIRAMIKRFTLAVLFIFSGLAVNAQQAPADFLGYELGSEWTPHYKVMQYFQHVADQSDLVTYQSYGETYEGRELTYAIVTSSENHRNLEEIRLNNLRLTGLESGEITSIRKPIVWLSYNVHGNETSSSEAAMNMIYKLLTEKSSWLNDVIVIMDPMINPDGRDRYVYWNKSVTGDQFNARPDAREHDEPWPNGRTNHYYFDLNRDWAWQTQVESQHRIKLYNKWMPQVHVDYHEQGYNSPYYFAPAAEPFHKAITDWQREFQGMIGKNHTNYFDEEGWLYFTGEVFDLFYPSYGDTWPTFNGAIGMTYEQAGQVGLGIQTAEGDTLSLLDRLTHHTITGLSTVEITARNAGRVLDEFEKYFDQAQNDPAGQYKAYVVKKTNNPDKIGQLLRYLADQRISYGMATRNSNANGYDFITGTTGRQSIEEGDLVIPARQPKSTLVRVLFEPKPELADSVTYDLTAWEMHYALGLSGSALTSEVDTRAFQMQVESEVTPYIEKPYAYLAKWGSLEDLRYLTRLLNDNIKVRYAEKPFTMEGNSYNAGTLIITRNGNEHMGLDFDQKVKDHADDLGRVVTPVSTGLVQSGSDFGSGNVSYIDKPRVAMLSGEGTSSGDVGHAWHFFDQQIGYQVTLINLERMGSIQWTDYDVLIMPGGRYNNVLEDEGLAELRSWIRSGGTLIALGGANSFLSGKEGFSLKQKEVPDEESDPNDLLKIFGEAENNNAQYSNPGSVFKLRLDTTHPMAFGYDETYFSLKMSSTGYAFLENGWNVGVALDDGIRSGFVGNRAKEQLNNSLSVGVEPIGRGQVVYMIDNPLYRGFWHNGKLLVGNAVFMVSN